MQLIETQASQLARANNDTVTPAAVGYLNAAEVCLYQTELVLTPLPDLATFAAAECDYNGYAPEAITWGAPTVADDGTVEVIGSVGQFVPTDALAPNNAWGVYITNAAGSALYFAGQFDGAPLPMNSTLDQITVTVRYRPATNTVVVVVS